jgi:hypothetical protein
MSFEWRIRMAPVFGLLLAWATLSASENVASEYQVKAAYLLNFTKFVEWPQSAFESPNSPLTICILGDDPFGSLVDQLVEGETVNGRKLAVQRLRRVPEPKLCQVLFISRSEKDVSEVLTGLGPGVLTVADRDGFLREGGAIAFLTEDRHVRFDISQRAAANASLSLNSRLLSVARSVNK